MKSKSVSIKGRKKEPKLKKKKKKVLAQPLPTATAEDAEKEDSKSKDKRKTRWETATFTENSSEKITNQDDESSGNPRGIRNLLGNKKSVVEFLFQVVPGDALQELIPDYLKSFTEDELKQLCLTQIQTMTDECILNVISGKESFQDCMKKAETDLELSLCSDTQESMEQDSPEKAIPSESTDVENADPSLQNEDSSDVLELCVNSNETIHFTDEENLSPFSVQEIAKDLPLPGNDSELLELEMRARAIRSLLKAKEEDLEEKNVADME